MSRWAGEDEARADWVKWVVVTLYGSNPERDLPESLAALTSMAEALCDGPNPTAPSELWNKEEGRDTRTAMTSFEAAAEFAPPVTARDVSQLLDHVLSQGQTRNPQTVDPRIAILGTIEARGLSADVVILAGLNEGTWPASPTPDPWLNRSMRMTTGLLLPERRIGLAAHDFQQAIAAHEVVLTRSRLSDGAETVPARWLNRLTNLLAGLGDDGQAALSRMRADGATLVREAAVIEAPRPEDHQARAIRPAPCPPVAARPRELSVTAITTLRRDPYAIYAQRILGLKPLEGLRPVPDARERGNALHDAMERFLERRDTWLDDPQAARDALDQAVSETLEARVPDPALRAFWRARFLAEAERVLEGEHERLSLGAPILLEDKGGVPLDQVDFRLTAKPDRIDRRDDGTFAVFDYKTGKPPTEKQVAALDRQLPLTAAMVERGGFPGLRGTVSHMAYIGLGRASGTEDPIKIQDKEGLSRLDQAWDDLTALIGRFARRDTGYTARLAAEMIVFEGDYEHLARFGEWTHAQRATPQDVGGPDDGV